MIRAALVIVLAAGAVADADVVSSGPLRIRARADLVLGVDLQAELTLQPGAARMVTSTGTIALDEDGRRAVLQLPEARYPHVAIVAALDAGGEVIDWLAIPLAGQARVKVETAPSATVVVRIADRDAGLVQADRRGVATVPIVVPPGVATVTTIATTTAGNVTEKSASLGVASFVRTLALCGATKATVFAVEPGGAPSTVAPTLAISRGTVTAPRARGPGWFESGVSVLDDGATLVATLGDDRTPAGCEIVLPPEVPTDATLTATRTRHVAGDGPITLGFEIGYPGRRARVTPAVALTVDVGAVEQRDGTSRWVLPAAFAGRRTAHAHLEVTWPGGRIVRQVEVALVPGPPARLDVATPRVLRADGAATDTLVVRILDRHGNPTVGALRARARGTVGPFTRRGDAMIASYVAPHARAAGDDRLVVVEQTTGASAELRVPLRPLPRRFGAGVRAGFVANFGRITAPLLAVSADLRLPLLAERLTLGGEVGGFRARFDTAAELETVSTAVSGVPVLARLALRERRGKLGLWGGVGGGVVFAWTRVAASSAGVVTAMVPRPALAGFVGGSYAVGDGQLGVELGYLQTRLPSDGAVHGRLGGAVGTITYRIER